MRQWGFWEWMAYAALFLAALILAADAGIKGAPEVTPYLAGVIGSPWWAFAPLMLILAATAILFVREFRPRDEHPKAVPTAVRATAQLSEPAQISLTFENSPTFVVRSQSGDVTRVRVKAVNLAAPTAIGCRPKLIAINKADGGRVKTLGVSDVFELAWSNQTQADAFSRLDMAKDVPQFIDIVCASKKDNQLRPVTSVVPDDFTRVFRKQGVYRLTLQVIGANARSNPLAVDVHWSGGDQVNANVVAS